MSGRRIDDHASFAGKGKPLPMGNKVKEFSSAEGMGKVGTDYDDTSERVKSVQEMGKSKIKSKPMKAGYRY